MLIICVSLRISIQHSPQYVYLANSHNGNWVASSVLVLPPPQNQTVRQPATHFPTKRDANRIHLYFHSRAYDNAKMRNLFLNYFETAKNAENPLIIIIIIIMIKESRAGDGGVKGICLTWSYNSWMRPTATDLVHNTTDSWWSFSCSDSPPPPAFKWAQ